MGALADDDVAERLRALSGWERAGQAIQKAYTFPSYDAVIAFVNRVAALAQAQDHHPDMLVQYGQVKLTLSSHDSGGLTARDFRLAQAIDAEPPV